MEKLLRDHFGIEVRSIKKLNGYENVNYKVETAEKSFVFKTYPFDAALHDILDAENEVLLELDQHSNTLFPLPIAYLDGDFLKKLTWNGTTYSCRLLTFLEGQFFGENPQQKQAYRSLGTTLAKLNLQLQPIKNYVLMSRQWEWDVQYLLLNKKYIEFIPDKHDQNIVRYFIGQFEQNVLPIASDLPKQIIHNDANEWNILGNGDEVTGIIDFGDLAYTWRVCEVAVAMTYAAYDKQNPMEWALEVLAAYHKVTPLSAQEIGIIYYLMAGQLVISVCNSAYAKQQDPENVYAGISEKNAWKTLRNWLKISPIGTTNLFRTTCGLAPVGGKTLPEKIKERNKYLSPILSVSYQKPIAMERAAFQYMYDSEGNAILDAYNNIPHVGHSHPKIVAAGQEQMAKLNTNTRYLYDVLPQYAAKLLSKFPPTLNRVFFVNSGSAASDLALRLAHASSKHKHIMVMEHGYHGNTQLSIDISDYKFNSKKGQGQKNYILKTPIPDTYRGKYTDAVSAGKLYGQDAVQQIENAREPIAAFISEPIVGCGGQVPLAKGYLKEVYPAIRMQGGVCISDEVQTGFGRLGKWFWGFEAQEVVPDIVILGKPMGNGHPMGAVVCSERIATEFGKGVEFFSSFGGNPVSCAIGLAVLEVIEEENLQENALQVGEYFKSLFRDLAKRFNCIGDVRGEGLFIGVEIIKGETNEPDMETAHLIKNELRLNNILVSTDGPFDSVIKSKPPLCFTKENAEQVVAAIEEVLQKRDEL